MTKGHLPCSSKGHCLPTFSKFARQLKRRDLQDIFAGFHLDPATSNQLQARRVSGEQAASAVALAPPKYVGETLNPWAFVQCSSSRSLWRFSFQKKHPALGTCSKVPAGRSEFALEHFRTTEWFHVEEIGITRVLAVLAYAVSFGGPLGPARS